ncbi:MAG: Alpha/Beta hydrolase protein [Benniella sp.]|nr:MAG: Alpha/Beta hydrolase protein [Benniella sp.]
MALDYVEEIRQIQPHGPYCLLGYSFGGRVAHAMTACLERQGEQVALLAVMDTIPTDPTAETQASNWSLDDDTMLFVNRVVDSLPDNSRPYLERFRQVCSHISQLDRNHTTYPTCHTGMILFRAMVQIQQSLLFPRMRGNPMSWETLRCLISIAHTLIWNNQDP